ncbi:MAG: hypothetical protein EOO04_32960 [Chitinophagaceae bacterium]|nr:MAG: hypothetical protein EOO04_32960 [Chitinophagaceae bacterium]
MHNPKVYSERSCRCLQIQL